MQARRREKEGGRIPATKAELLDHNRSRAVAWGLSARLEQETERPVREPQGNRRQPAAALPDCSGTDRATDPRTPARTASHGGPRSRDHAASRRDGPARLLPGCGPDQNDLFANWRLSGKRDLEGRAIHAMLSSRDMLAADQITQANMEMMPGAMAVVEDHWSELLQRRDLRRAPRTDNRPTGADKRGHGRDDHVDGRSSADRDGPQALAQATLVTALIEASDRNAAVAAVRRHAALGQHSIIPALKQLNNEEAKQIRRTLRPPGSKVLRLRDSTDISGQLGKLIMETVFQAEEQFVTLDIQMSERGAGTRAIDAFRRSLPDSVATVLVTNTSYEGGKRVSLELLVLDMKGHRSVQKQSILSLTCRMPAASPARPATSSASGKHWSSNSTGHRCKVRRPGRSTFRPGAPVACCSLTLRTRRG